MGNLVSLIFRSGASRPRILFLVTQDPKSIRPEWPYYQNWMLPSIVKDRGGDVDILCWRDPSMNGYTVSQYDVVSFLWCNNYHNHPIEFPNFLRNTLIPAQKLKPDIHIMNDPEVALWNTDKHYLLGLAKAGFGIPQTAFLDLRQYNISSLLAHIGSIAGSRPQVLKPAISGSAKMTHWLENPRSPSSNDLDFLETALSQGMDGDLILQEYQKTISDGEYSLIFINDEYVHTILKTPQSGEFRCQGEFGGSVKEIAKNDVPKAALETGHGIMAHLRKKFPPKILRDGSVRAKLVYARIDGIMKDGHFLLMEVEAIEPHLWFESGAGARGLDEFNTHKTSHEKWIEPYNDLVKPMSFPQTLTHTHVVVSWKLEAQSTLLE
ncbi:hypothetical protein G7Y79_00021g050690 [Physcia stellaris]|nr:hypothetical protein G7Y79_00021g050690 [Physcia stellaris]